MKTAIYRKGDGVDGIITWEAHLKAYIEYRKVCDTWKSADTISKLGGFTEKELDKFYPEWRNHIL